MICQPSGQTMPACGNCEGFVTQRYVDVFAPTGADSVRVCPNCEDLVRDGNGVREARSKRQ
ncbi:DUF7563 family protein [Halobaculum rarum]|uniref:DUF7563 family protein n=1 Tax=Halobaculum rarum TaxID=3075122 RepID=UPI003D69123B